MCQEVWLPGEERVGGEREIEDRFRKEVENPHPLGIEMELARSVRLLVVVESMSPI